MYPVCSILRGIDYHIYPDDTQLYITFDLSDPTIVIDKINDSKTEFMVVTSSVF